MVLLLALNHTKLNGLLYLFHMQIIIAANNLKYTMKSLSTIEVLKNIVIMNFFDLYSFHNSILKNHAFFFFNNPETCSTALKKTLGSI